MELAGPRASLEQERPGPRHRCFSVPPPPCVFRRKAHEILSFHRPCQTQALTCFPKMLTILALDAEPPQPSTSPGLNFPRPFSQQPPLLPPGAHLCWRRGQWPPAPGQAALRAGFTHRAKGPRPTSTSPVSFSLSTKLRTSLSGPASKRR